MPVSPRDPSYNAGFAVAEAEGDQGRRESAAGQVGRRDATAQSAA
jgi:hypothetical protein